MSYPDSESTIIEEEESSDDIAIIVKEEGESSDDVAIIVTIVSIVLVSIFLFIILICCCKNRNVKLGKYILGELLSNTTTVNRAIRKTDQKSFVIKQSKKLDEKELK